MFLRAIGVVSDTVPTVAALALAGAIGWWGHHTGWTVPKFSSLTGQANPVDDWCSAHGVPESACVECDPTLMPKPKSHGWCRIHGVPECPLCHPDVAQLPAATVSDADRERAKRAIAFAPRLENNPTCRTQVRRIQFATPADADKAGISIAVASLDPVEESVSAPAELQHDPARVARLSSRASGTVWQLFKRPGDAVKAGDVLALIDAADVGKAKAELLHAVADADLKRRTLASLRNAGGAEPAGRVRDADAAVREGQIRVGAARQALVNLGLPLDPADLAIDTLDAKLQFLGVPADLVHRLDPARTTSNLLPVIAPHDGVVTALHAVTGEAVEPARVLVETADSSRLWLLLDLSAADARQVKAGQPVRFRPDHGGEEVTALLAWVSPQVDGKTRSVKARAELSSTTLRANSFGTARIVLRQEPNAITVPTGAVQNDGCCSIVFVRDKAYLRDGAPKVYHIRKVRLGARGDRVTEIAAGLLPGEVVAHAGSGLLLTELLRDGLGEGCACHSKK